MLHELTFPELRTRMFERYLAGDYAQALDLVERHAGQFPDRAARTTFWRVCLNARLNRTAEAIRLLDQALAAGYWWAEDRLRNDEDLKSLQGLPQFERAVEICRRRFQAARAQVKPELVVLPPDHAQPPYPVLLALHGRGGNAGDDTIYWRPAVSLGWLVTLPQSAQVFDLDAYAWDDGEQAHKQITLQFAELCQQYPVDRGRVVVSGYSQGGALAIWLAMSGMIQACGFITVVPSVWIAETLAPLIGAGQMLGLRGYVITGQKDPRHEQTKELVRLLQSHGIACEMESHPDLGHDFPVDFASSLNRALAFVLPAK